jgi:hypothetical protein
MKKVLLAMGLMVGGVAFVNAQDRDTTSTQSTQQTTTQDQSMTQDQDDQGVQIQVSELPEPVRTKLQTQDYQGWVVSSAHRKNWTDPQNTQATSQEIYVVEVKNGADTKKLKFDKEGNEIMKDKDEDQK